VRSGPIGIDDTVSFELASSSLASFGHLSGEAENPLRWISSG